MMVAMGMIRLSYKDRILPDPIENCRFLAALPPGTVVRAVLGGHKVEIGPVSGLDSNGNLRFGRKSLKPTACADVTPFPWAEPRWGEDRLEIVYQSDFLKDMIPSADPVLFASEANAVCAIIGPPRELETELQLHVTRSPDSVHPRPLHEALRPFDRYKHMGWQSVVASSQAFDWPMIVSQKLPRLLVLDGASAVNRWLGETSEAEVVLALVHRPDASAASAAEALLNQCRSAVDIDVRALGWTPPPAVEVIAYGVPA
ncbi:hypothetical protein ACVDFE_00685 [Lentzea chajnantorensis]